MPIPASLHLHVRVQPNARQNALVEFQGGTLKVKIAAPAIEGKANRQLVKFLAECASKKCAAAAW